MILLVCSLTIARPCSNSTHILCSLIYSFHWSCLLFYLHNNVNSCLRLASSGPDSMYPLMEISIADCGNCH